MTFLSEPRQGAVTFAEPGSNDPYTFTIADVGEDLSRLGKVVAAAERQQLLVDNMTARIDAIDQAVERRIAAVKKATGVTLENYTRPAFNQRPEDMAVSDFESPRDAFHRRLRELEEANPDHAVTIRADTAIEDDAKAAAKNAEMEFQTIYSDPKIGTATGFGAAVAGGLKGALRDPLQMLQMYLGGGAGTAKTIIARMGQVTVREAAVNAAGTALMQPSVQHWRKDVGLKSGIVPALENVGMAALFGAIVGGGIQGVRELPAGARKSVERIRAGDATPKDVEIAADALGVKLPDNEQAALRQAAREADTAIADGEPLPGVARETHEDLAAQAVRHAEDPAGQPPPDLATIAPARPADQVKVLDEQLPAKTGDRETIDGKPVTFERFDPAELKSDASVFQFKGGGDAEGVTDRLRHVAQWDPTASGKTFVFERKNGDRVIADGHQRLGLAKRLQDPKARLDGYLFREADGWSAADVRAMAAKKNLQEGSGDAIDAAKILRSRPEILDGALPVSGPMMRNAIALSRLSDEAFGAAVNGVVPPSHAAAVGSMVPDPLQHGAVIADLARFKPETEREARLLIGEILSAGFRAEQQINLFGAAEATRSLMAERVRTLDAALSALVKDKQLFGTLAQKADAIEEAGNVLQRQVNEQRASDAAALSDLVSRLAQKTGPVSDALNRAAAQVADGASPKKAADAFLDELRTILDRDGLPALLAEPQLKAQHVVEPGTPEALQVAETAAIERSEATPAGDQLLMPGVEPVTAKATAQAAADKPLRGGDAPAGGLFDDAATRQTDLIDSIAVSSREDGADVRFISREAALEEADKSALHADLIKSCKD